MLFVTILTLCMTAPPQTTAQELATLKGKVMAADYRADIKGLAELRDELSKWPRERELAYLARYWSGFSSWRMAINGANNNMKSEELSTNLKNAAADFYASMRMKDDFADAYVAASMVNAWMSVFAGSDAAAKEERLSLSKMLFARANALDGRNPRVLWAKGGYSQFVPESQGGGVKRSIEIYKEMIEEADRRGVDPTSPLPDWGKPEALMSLEYTHSKLTPPDLMAAREEANAALKLQPQWSYVRDNLLPQIEKQRDVEH